MDTNVVNLITIGSGIALLILLSLVSQRLKKGSKKNLKCKQKQKKDAPLKYSENGVMKSEPAHS